MTSIGTVTPNSTQATQTSGTTQTGVGSLGNQSAFLSLLVAQLKNQDPTNPVDGTAFVTQLAEFNDVQQNLAIRQDMDAVSMKYLGTTSPPSSASTTDGASSTGATTAATNTSTSTLNS
jgi:flagellar basal-body rod modification protein FlgD